MAHTQTPSADSEAFFHNGHRSLQDRADSRRIADRITDLRRHDCFSDDDIQQITAAPFFFLATADAMGRPDCSVKGGEPGFVEVIGPNRLRFPDYDGNGMFRSLGNIAVNPAIGLVFVDFTRGRKLRINGRASVEPQSPGPGLQVVMTAEHIFPNCPRYLPKMVMLQGSINNPKPGHIPPPPDWKAKPELRDFLPKSADVALATTR